MQAGIQPKARLRQNETILRAEKGSPIKSGMTNYFVSEISFTVPAKKPERN
jgi:hypothetical protein